MYFVYLLDTWDQFVWWVTVYFFHLFTTIPLPRHRLAISHPLTGLLSPAARPPTPQRDGGCGSAHVAMVSQIKVAQLVNSSISLQ